MLQEPDRQAAESQSRPGPVSQPGGCITWTYARDLEQWVLKDCTAEGEQEEQHAITLSADINQVRRQADHQLMMWWV